MESHAYRLGISSSCWQYSGHSRFVKWMVRSSCVGIAPRPLRACFARFGVPNTVVSNNAPEFTCAQFRGWLEAIGCRLLHTPEYHPQSNGTAERMVHVVKDAMKCYNPSKCSVQAFIHRFLMVQRNSAMREDKSPAEIMLGRTLRCPSGLRNSFCTNRTVRQR